MIVRENLRVTASNAEDAAAILRAILMAEDVADRDKEHFWVLGLDNALHIKYIDLVSLGTLTASFAEPREVFRLAVSKGIKSIICAHNHPSGTLEESDVDKITTDRLKEAGKVLGINLLDHIIVTKEGHLSFRDMGYI